MPETCYLFSYFAGEKDGLHMAWSRDGLKWEALKERGKEKIFLKPALEGDNLMRDPCLLLGPDGVFRMVWTTSWHDRAIGYAWSKDLVHWSKQRSLPVMKHEPTARNTWAPELHYDAAEKRYLIFWSSTIPGRFPETADTAEEGLNHRFYVTTTADFESFTPTRLFFDPKFCAIDATVLSFRNKFWLIFKNETLKPVAAKDLFLATSDRMEGPYGEVTGPIATRPAHWVEGPTAIEIGGRVIIYYDCYAAGHFGACASSDMRNWVDVTPELSMPKGIRHGTVLAVPGSVVAELRRALGEKMTE